MMQHKETGSAHGILIAVACILAASYASNKIWSLDTPGTKITKSAAHALAQLSADNYENHLAGNGRSSSVHSCMDVIDKLSTLPNDSEARFTSSAALFADPAAGKVYKCTLTATTSDGFYSEDFDVYWTP